VIRFLRRLVCALVGHNRWVRKSLSHSLLLHVDTGCARCGGEYQVLVNWCRIYQITKQDSGE
jgi:hypothetical protein